MPRLRYQTTWNDVPLTSKAQPISWMPVAWGSVAFLTLLGSTVSSDRSTLLPLSSWWSIRACPSRTTLHTNGPEPRWSLPPTCGRVRLLVVLPNTFGTWGLVHARNYPVTSYSMWSGSLCLRASRYARAALPKVRFWGRIMRLRLCRRTMHWLWTRRFARMRCARRASPIGGGSTGRSPAGSAIGGRDARPT